MENTYISKEELKELISGIKPAFSDATQLVLPDTTDILKQLQVNGSISLKQLYQHSEHIIDIYLSAILKRVVVVKLCLMAREGKKLDLNFIWNLLYKSLITLSAEDIISSIGSQGFLSIPLYRLDMDKAKFEFLRLHIWDSSLDKYIDKQKTAHFSIHSHQFHANSWILAGEIINIRYKVETSLNETDFNHFEIKWNNSKNAVNQKTSVAMNTGEYVSVETTANEKYTSGDTYEIEAGEFHASTNSSQVSSTLFLFSTLKSRVDKSFVIGPSIIKESEVNRKVQIDSKEILDRLNSNLVDYE